jgi:hypothetical protein
VPAAPDAEALLNDYARMGRRVQPRLIRSRSSRRKTADDSSAPRG